MFDKKFTVRVVHYHEKRYKIEYAYYRFFKIWHTLYEYLTFNVYDDLYGWNPVLLKVKDAEKYAKDLTMESINKHYHNENKKELEFLKAKQEWLEKEFPYESKVIK